jgi:hypothetical protein
VGTVDKKQKATIQHHGTVLYDAKGVLVGHTATGWSGSPSGGVFPLLYDRDAVFIKTIAVPHRGLLGLLHSFSIVGVAGR